MQYSSPPPSSRANQLSHTVANIQRAPRIPGKYGTPTPSRLRVSRLHDKSAAYALYPTNRFQDTEYLGNYFIVPTTAITNTDQKSEESQWQARKKLLDTYRNMRTNL